MEDFGEVKYFELISTNFFLAADFMKNYELDGVYVANRYPPTEAIDQTRKISTAVTFDLGGEWRNLTPPATDIHGKPLQCNDVRSALNFFNM